MMYARVQYIDALYFYEGGQKMCCISMVLYNMCVKVTIFDNIIYT